MPSDWIYVAGDNNGLTIGGNLSRFFNLAGALQNSTTEAEFQLLARAAYTWQNIGVRVTQNNLDAQTSIFARLEGVDQTALEIQISAGQTGFFEDTVGSVSVADGDLINYRIATGTGAHGDTITVHGIVGQLQHASLERPMVVSAGVPLVFQATSRFFPIIGFLRSGATTETDIEYILRQGVTFSNMRCFVSFNDVDNPTTFDFREDGVSSTNLTISIPANTTGAFEDTDSEVVSTGSTVNYRLVVGAGLSADTIQLRVMQMLQAGSVTGRNLGASDPAPTSGFGINTTNYLALESISSFFSTTELDNQVEVPVAIVFTDMFVRVTVNSLTTADTTIALRVDGADSLLDLSIAAGVTGTFEDSDTVSVVVDGLVDWELAVAAGGSGTITVIIMALEQGQPSVTEPFEDSEVMPGNTTWGIGRRVVAMPY